MVWKGPMSAFMEDQTRLIDAEGAFRSGKTTAALWKVYNSCIEQPGIKWLICRFGDGDTQSKLKPPWRDILHRTATTYSWHPDEQYDELSNGSRVYIMGLKASDEAARYAKLRGMTLGGVYNDQTEELPHDVFLELAGRLSQSGVRHQMILTPNPPNEDHWLTKEFPDQSEEMEKKFKGRRKYYRFSIYDNAHNLPTETIEELEFTYPRGHAKHRSAVLGLRGMNVIGDPVYAGYFNRLVHVNESLEMDRHAPLIEAWDFGHSHPCVVYLQVLSIGRLAVLGAVMGHNVYLEDFAPAVGQVRSQWFPNPMEILSVGDPMGLDVTNQGVQVSKVRDILAASGSFPISQSHANRPEVRYQAIQNVSSYMRHIALDGRPAFQIRPRDLVVTAGGAKPAAFVTDGLEAGYVWDTRQVIGSAATIRRPKKDGYYDHAQNGIEYAVLQYGQTMPTIDQVRKLKEKEVRNAQRDYDEADPPRGRRYASGRAGRGGY